MTSSIHEDNNVNQTILVKALQQAIAERIESTPISLIDVLGALDVVKWVYLSNALNEEA